MLTFWQFNCKEVSDLVGRVNDNLSIQVQIKFNNCDIMFFLESLYSLSGLYKLKKPVWQSLYQNYFCSDNIIFRIAFVLIVLYQKCFVMVN